MRDIKIFDTTLRDGAQAEGVSFSDADRLNIIRLLDDFGIAFIELPAANFPVSNCATQSKLVAFGSTRRPYLSVEKDTNCAALLAANTATVAIYGKAWDLHVKNVLRCELSENLRMIEESIAFFKREGRRVIFDAEHFFDGFKASPSYCKAVLEAACAADVVALCDTNGGAFPDEVFQIVQEIQKCFPALTLGIHAHNDRGMAVANTIMAVSAGASHVQGTFIGMGERCGNADLCSVIANLQLGRALSCVPENSLTQLTSTARAIAEIANIHLSESAPYVGASAFAHKAGTHIDGMIKCDRAFEHVAPQSVGNTRRYLTSEIAGRALLLNKISPIYPDFDPKDPRLSDILRELKERESAGYQYEGADASFSLIIRKVLGLYAPFFELIYYKTIGEGDGATATLKIRVGDREELSAGEGNGPVNALDQALRKALEVFYPKIRDIRLIDYKVRVLDSKSGTEAQVRVLITSTDGHRHWTTVGVSEDIIQASWIALCDSVEFKLSED
ncbi:(R)-citramalate synthase [Clostridia bacterium]|nr:(R)-citramalate synthase [Clostridia bacterium]